MLHYVVCHSKIILRIGEPVKYCAIFDIRKAAMPCRFLRKNLITTLPASKTLPAVFNVTVIFFVLLLFTFVIFSFTTITSSLTFNKTASGRYRFVNPFVNSGISFINDTKAFPAITANSVIFSFRSVKNER